MQPRYTPLKLNKTDNGKAKTYLDLLGLAGIVSNENVDAAVRPTQKPWVNENQLGEYLTSLRSANILKRALYIINIGEK
jgi:hypothetical protein